MKRASLIIGVLMSSVWLTGCAKREARSDGADAVYRQPQNTLVTAKDTAGTDMQGLSFNKSGASAPLGSTAGYPSASPTDNDVVVQQPPAKPKPTKPH